jgi:ribosome-binding protein aMBF1 (putative translation factor)
MIEIRLAQDLSRKLETEITQVIDEVNKDESGIRVKLYKKENLTNDYLIVIMNQKKKHGPTNKDLGQRLKAAFREYGLVNHTVWNEIGNDIQSEL